MGWRDAQGGHQTPWDRSEFDVAATGVPVDDLGDLLAPTVEPARAPVIHRSTSQSGGRARGGRPTLAREPGDGDERLPLLDDVEPLGVSWRGAQEAGQGRHPAPPRRSAGPQPVLDDRPASGPLFDTSDREDAGPAAPWTQRARLVDPDPEGRLIAVGMYGIAALTLLLALALAMGVRGRGGPVEEQPPSSLPESAPRP